MRLSLLLLLLVYCLPVDGTAQPSPEAAKAARPKSAAFKAETGTLTGTITSTKKVKTKGATSQKDFVVYLTDVKGDFPPPSKPIKVEQEKLTFVPHVLPVVKGTKVEFTNKDTVKHNVFSSDACCKMDVDMDGGKSGSFTFSDLGVGAIICRIHPEMSMFVIVLENPFFAKSELKRTKVDGKRAYVGDYKIEGIPPGTYKLKTWNKKLKAIEADVTIKAGEATTFDVVVGS